MRYYIKFDNENVPLQFIKHQHQVEGATEVIKEVYYETRAKMGFNDTEALRQETLQLIDGKCSAAIYAGFDLNGKHYTATENDQSNIKDALLAFQLGKTTYPWAAVGESRTPHTEAQITAIATGMSSWGIVCTGYLAQLRALLAAESDSAVLNGIDFGVALPTAYMKALGAELAQYGINLADYAAMLSGG